MKTIEISDELYEELKAYVVDPFEDNAEVVISRLVQIANKARQKCAPLEPPPPTNTRSQPTMAERTRISYEDVQFPEQSQEVVL